jgi:hypothetical protein
LIRKFSSPGLTTTSPTGGTSPLKSPSPQPPTTPSKQERERGPAVPQEPPSASTEPPASALSAAAPSFAPSTSPAPPPPDVSSFDQETESFAQTGAAEDDLFDDVVPVDPGMRVRSEEDLFSEGFTPVTEVVVEQSQQQPPQPQGRQERGRGRGRGRARGRGDRGGARGGRAESEANGSRDTPPENAPTGPKKETPAAVRGDRQATGGVKKSKLTDEELEARIANIRIKNASLTAAHARAEADAASFAQREEAARQQSTQDSARTEKRRKEERRDRQQMMGEREKNRARKLKALEGREWDSEKKEEDFEKGGVFDEKGFGRDREDWTDGREYLYQEPRPERGRGRGRGRGGRGRGGEDRVERPPRQEEFPALPPARKDGAPAANDIVAAKVGNWADQVESSS